MHWREPVCVEHIGISAMVQKPIHDAHTPELCCQLNGGGAVGKWVINIHPPRRYRGNGLYVSHHHCSKQAPLAIVESGVDAEQEWNQVINVCAARNQQVSSFNV